MIPVAINNSHQIFSSPRIDLLANTATAASAPAIPIICKTPVKRNGERSSHDAPHEL